MRAGFGSLPACDRPTERRDGRAQASGPRVRRCDRRGQALVQPSDAVHRAPTGERVHQTCPAGVVQPEPSQPLGTARGRVVSQGPGAACDLPSSAEPRARIRAGPHLSRRDQASASGRFSTRGSDAASSAGASVSCSSRGQGRAACGHAQASASGSLSTGSVGRAVPACAFSARVSARAARGCGAITPSVWPPDTSGDVSPGGPDRSPSTGVPARSAGRAARGRAEAE